MNSVFHLKHRKLALVPSLPPGYLPVFVLPASQQNYRKQSPRVKPIYSSLVTLKWCFCHNEFVSLLDLLCIKGDNQSVKRLNSIKPYLSIPFYFCSKVNPCSNFIIFNCPKALCFKLMIEQMFYSRT